jgi:hypothetical protein
MCVFGYCPHIRLEGGRAYNYVYVGTVPLSCWKEEEHVYTCIRVLSALSCRRREERVSGYCPHFHVEGRKYMSCVAGYCPHFHVEGRKHMSCVAGYGPHFHVEGRKYMWCVAGYCFYFHVKRRKNVSLYFVPGYCPHIHVSLYVPGYCQYILVNAENKNHENGSSVTSFLRAWTGHILTACENKVGLIKTKCGMN